MRTEYNLQSLCVPDEYDVVQFEAFAVTPEGDQGDSLGIIDSDGPDVDGLPEEVILVELASYYAREVP